jgi:hypothetical protein
MATLVGATEITVMLMVVVEEGSFSAHRADGVVSLPRATSSNRSSLRKAESVGRELVITGTAEILLVAEFVFAITIKVVIVVALRAADMV